MLVKREHGVLVWCLTAILLLTGAVGAADAHKLRRTERLEAKLAKANVRKDHPRLFITRETIPEYRERMKAYADWPAIQKDAKSGKPAEAAFCYLITEDKSYATIAAEALRTGKGSERDRALAFDWAYNAFSEEDRRKFAQDLFEKIGLPSRAEFGGKKHLYRKGIPWTFHSEEWCGYDMDEGIYTLVALAGEHSEIKGEHYVAWFAEDAGFGDAARFLAYLSDGFWPEGGYWKARGKWGLMAQVFHPLRTACGIDLFRDPEHPYFHNTGLYLLYATDHHAGKFLHNVGDSNVDLMDKRSQQLQIISAWDLAAGENPYVYWWMKNMVGHRPNGLVGALLYNPLVKEKPPAEASFEELPPSRLFTGGDVAIMRSGWDKDATWASFNNQDYNGYCHEHQGAEICSFTFYKRGVLCPDSGYYDVAWGTPHFWNYYASSTAHNGITVMDPDEKTSYVGREINDGGWQLKKKHLRFRTWREDGECDIAQTRAWESRPAYDYVVGEGTRAFSPHKVKEFIRSLVFLRRGHLIVFDRVESGKPEFEKRWLLHLNGEPKLDGQVVKEEVKGHIVTYDGSLAVAPNKYNSAAVACRTLLPERHTITKVGGNLGHLPSTTLVKVPQKSFKGVARAYHYYKLQQTIDFLNPLRTPPQPEAAIGLHFNDERSCQYEVTGSHLALWMDNEHIQLDFKDFPTLEKLWGGLAAKLKKLRKVACSLMAGYEYYNGGKNWAILGPRATMEGGTWRLEVRPAKPAARDYFLHVISALDSVNDAPPTAEASEAGDTVTVMVKGKDFACTVSFAKSGAPKGHIKVEEGGKILEDRDLATSVVLTQLHEPKGAP